MPDYPLHDPLLASALAAEKIAESVRAPLPGDDGTVDMADAYPSVGVTVSITPGVPDRDAWSLSGNSPKGGQPTIEGGNRLRRGVGRPRREDA